MQVFWNQYETSIIVSTWNEPGVLNAWEDKNSWLFDLEEVELVVVDNRNHFTSDSHGRDDDLDRILSYSASGAKWCAVSHSTGCGGGWAMGALLATGQFLLFVDDKCYFTEETYHKLIDAMKHDPKIGMVGVKGGFREYDDRGTTLQKGIEPNHPINVDEVSGFLWGTPYEVYAEIGGLDPRFRPAGHEETDYAFNTRKHGYTVRLIPGCDFTHQFDLSARDVRVEWLDICERTRVHIDERNKALFAKKWANFPSVLTED